MEYPSSPPPPAPRSPLTGQPMTRIDVVHDAAQIDIIHEDARALAEQQAREHMRKLMREAEEQNRIELEKKAAREKALARVRGRGVGQPPMEDAPLDTDSEGAEGASKGGESKGASRRPANDAEGENRSESGEEAPASDKKRRRRE